VIAPFLAFLCGVGVGVALILTHDRRRVGGPFASEAPADTSDVPFDHPLGVIDVQPGRLAELRREPLFPVLLLLGRMSNALRFAHTAPLEVYDEGTPRAGRQLNGAFFIQIATTQEAIDTLRKLAVHLKDRAVWQERVVPLLRDPDVLALENEGVRELRRKIAFHFDLDAIRKGLSQAKETNVRLLASRGSATKDVYFPYSDEVALAFIVPTRGLTPEQYRASVLPWLRRSTELSIRVAEIIEALITDIARSYGLQGQWLPDADPQTGSDA